MFIVVTSNAPCDSQYENMMLLFTNSLPNSAWFLESLLLH